MTGLAEASLRLVLWINLGALIVLAGCGIFRGVIWERSWTADRAASVERRFLRHWRRTVTLSGGAGVVSSLLLLLLFDQVGVEALRLGLLLLVMIGWLALRRSERRPALHPVGGPPELPERLDPVSRWPRVLGGIAVLALLLSLALTGHARSSSLPFPNLVVALVHVTAAATWVGGLVVLVAVAFPATRAVDPATRPRILAPVVARFSDAALWSVVAVVATGTYSAWVAIREPGELIGSPYGRVFLAKLAAFVPALIVGGINNQWTKPRLMRASRSLDPDGSPVRVLRRLVILEIALVAVVLGVTAFLLNLPTPVSAEGPP